MKLLTFGFLIADFAPFIAATRDAAPDIELVPVSIVRDRAGHPLAGGASFEQFIRDLRARHGNAWDGLLAEYASGLTYDAVAFACWSAGYGAPRELFRHEGEPPELALLAMLDSVYGGLDGDHGAPVDVAPFSAFAEGAIAGGVVMVLGASDIVYMELPPTPIGSRYASTSTMARSIAAAEGQRLEPCHYEGARPPNAPTAQLEAGSLLIELHDVGPGVGAEEHVAAVRAGFWGPALFARGARMLVGAPSDTEAPPATLPTGASADVLPSSPVAAVAEMQRAIGAPRTRTADLSWRFDGLWGPATSSALGALQRSTGLPERNVFGAPERAALAAMPRVLDVSHHQPPIDWPLVRQAGFEAVIVRAAYGATPDDAARAHWAGAGAAGLKRIGYTFLRPGRPIGAQVDAALATLPEARGWFVDVEDDPFSPGARHTRDELARAVSLLGAAARVGLYSAWGWWEACGLGVFAGVPIWNAGYNNHRLFAGARTWLLWQQEARPVPGVVGTCDVNLCSSRDELARWTV